MGQMCDKPAATRGAVGRSAGIAVAPCIAEGLCESARIFLGIVMMVAIVNVTAAKKVTVYDVRADFARYRTFSWIEPPNTSDPAIRAWLVEAIDSGWRKEVCRGSDRRRPGHRGTRGDATSANAPYVLQRRRRRVALAQWLRGHDPGAGL